MNVRQQQAFDEILAAGGAVAASDWTTGTGRFITRRKIPPNCALFERGDRNPPAYVKALFHTRPHVKRVVAVTQEYADYLSGEVCGD